MHPTVSPQFLEHFESIAMEDNPLIPGIAEDIVHEDILPRLPWHTRPLLIALNRAWRDELDAIGLQGQNGLNSRRQHIAKLTRLKQPLKCRIAVEYYYTDPKRCDDDAGTKVILVKIFDGQWRNVPHISEQVFGRARANPWLHGYILGVVDGTLYCGRNCIIALDVGSGLWHWKFVYRHTGQKAYICTSARAAGGLFLFYSHRHRGGNAYFHITEIPITGNPVWQEDSIMDNRLKYRAINLYCKPLFVHVGYGLHFFGADDYRSSVWFYDLNQRSVHTYGRIVNSVDEWFLGEFQRRSVNWHRTVYVETTVLLVAKRGGDRLEIVRYSSSTATWIIVGWMPFPPQETVHWSWCVEYDAQGEKQLYIYVLPTETDGAFKVHKWRVEEKEVEGRTRGKVWNDTWLPHIRVECQLVDEQRFEAPSDSDEAGGDQTQCGLTCHGFHRSDLPNFEDIPRDNESIFRRFDDVPIPNPR